MPYKEISGNIFNSKAQAIVNTVNCVGAMGKGVALDFKLRYPEMFKEYQRICSLKLLHPGQILPYRKEKPIILNFAIKDDWKNPSKVEWVEETLLKFVSHYQQLGIKSVAFPWMGAMNGGIPVETIKTLMRRYLSSLDDIDVEVYDFNPATPCHLYKELERVINNHVYSNEELVSYSRIQDRYWLQIINAMEHNSVTSLNTLCSFSNNGKSILGKTNIEKLFLFLTRSEKGEFAEALYLFQ